MTEIIPTTIEVSGMVFNITVAVMESKEVRIDYPIDFVAYRWIEKNIPYRAALRENLDSRHIRTFNRWLIENTTDIWWVDYTKDNPKIVFFKNSKDAIWVKMHWG